MASTVDPVPLPAPAELEFDGAAITDRALRAAQVLVDAGERQRLLRYLGRHTDLAGNGRKGGPTQAACAADFTMVLAALAHE